MSYKSQDLLSAALDESGLGLELTQFVNNFQPQPVYQVSPQPVENSPLHHLTSLFSPQPFHHHHHQNNLEKKSVLNNKANANYLVNPSVLVNRQNSFKSNDAFNGFERQNAQSSGQLSNKHVTKLWKNNEIKLARDATIVKSKPGHEDDVEEEEEEELGHAETYAEYKPSKLNIGLDHPDKVVETSSLSSVHPPDVWYRLNIPEEVIDYKHLSALQLEAIVYASQQHDQFLRDGTRAGFLIGDGAGVGKGRTIAGIIYENYLLGRKRAIWVSVSNDLKYDAQRDLQDIGAGKLDVHPLNKFKYAKITSKANGSVKKGVIFSTYSALIGESQSGSKYRTRLKQLLHWCRPDFDGVIVFDECHKAKNLCPIGSSKPTKTGLTVLELQNKLPKARVVYASATGASEPKNMAYMTRLGIWGPGTPFPEFSDFIQAIEKRGVGAMELVAMDMKLRGMYIARQLSFGDVNFRIEEIPLGKDFVKIYDESVHVWVEAREKFQQAAELIDAEQRMRKTMWGQFWSAHQRFFKYLCIASKVRHVVRLATEALKNNRCVVIGLQSTGEARTLEQLEEAGGELNDFVSTAKGVLQTLIEKHFPAPDRKRIHRLLGLDPVFTPPDSPTTSGMKRKQDRKSHLPVKRAKKELKKESDDDDSSDNRKSDSDAAASESEDDESHASSAGLSDSAESDFNPFGDGSGSDDDPWVTRKNKKKEKSVKKKKKKKKKSKKEKIVDESSKAMKSSKMNSISDTNGASNEPPKDAIERAYSMKEELLENLERIGKNLPPNTLDQLIDELGGPENVAEMTGRKGRIVSNDDGSIQYESRSEIDVPLETLNLTEKQRFMDGEKEIAIISEAASSGISLQSDRRAKNKKRRLHITLELPWSADRAIQQFGRTHRSNQVNAPEYLFLISDLAGERRFASIVAKRLESLGALTHGDRRATETRDLSRFNIDNKYGRTALEVVMKSVMLTDLPLVPPPSDYKGDFFADIRKALVGVGLVVQDERFPTIQTLDKDHSNISKFLNRILGMQVDLQNRLFKYFSDTLSTIINQAKKAGRFDMGILDLGTTGDKMKRTKRETFCFRHATGTTSVSLNTVTVERGMSWEQAKNSWSELKGKDEGFYVARQIRNTKQPAILAVEFLTRGGNRNEKMFSIYRPNTGLQLRQESLTEILKKYSKATYDQAEPHWQEQYDSATDVCSHAYWRGSCRRVVMGLPCDVGLRRRTYHVLDGSVLSVWSKVENVLAAMPGSHNTKMQVIRLKLVDGQRIVGILIPTNCIAPLITVLTQDSTKLYSESF